MKAKLIKKSAPKPATSRRPPALFAERMRAVGSAFVSIAGTNNTEQARAAIGMGFPEWRLRYFGDLFRELSAWETRLADHFRPLDALVIVTDRARAITAGQAREIQTAQRLGKTLVIFNLDSGRVERFAGFAERRGFLKKWTPPNRSLPDLNSCSRFDAKCERAQTVGAA